MNSSVNFELNALLDAVAERAASKVLAGLRELLATPRVETVEYYDQDTAPIGRRKYLKAARAGEFASFKKGRDVLARKPDVDAWIALGARTHKPANDDVQQPPPASLAEVLAMNGYAVPPGTPTAAPAAAASSRRAARKR